MCRRFRHFFPILYIYYCLPNRNEYLISAGKMNHKQTSMCLCSSICVFICFIPYWHSFGLLANKKQIALCGWENFPVIFLPLHNKLPSHGNSYLHISLTGDDSNSNRVRRDACFSFFIVAFTGTMVSSLFSRAHTCIRRCTSNYTSTKLIVAIIQVNVRNYEQFHSLSCAHFLASRSFGEQRSNSISAFKYFGFRNEQWIWNKTMRNHILNRFYILIIIFSQKIKDLFFVFRTN